MKSQGFFIHDIPSEEPSFEAITGYLKTFSKSIKENNPEKQVFIWWMDFNGIEGIQRGKFAL